MGVGRGGWRWEQSSSPLLAEGGRCWLWLYLGFLSHPLRTASVTVSRGEQSLPVSLPAQRIAPAEPGCFGCCSATAACCFLVFLCCLINRIAMSPVCPKEGSKIPSRTASKAASPPVPAGDLWGRTAAWFAATSVAPGVTLVHR